MSDSPSQPAKDKGQGTKDKRPHPVRKWLARIAGVILGLILLILVAVQIVLWTSVPKSLVVSEIEKGMGLRMGANSLSTGWLGHTTLKGVDLALPLQSQAFLGVPEMKVRHTNLLLLLLGRPTLIKSIELDNPTLYVRQDVAGRWNLQEISELLSRAGGKQTGQQSAQSSSIPILPTLTIHNMTIVLLDNHGRQAKIAPLNVNGAPDGGPIAWKYDVEVQGHLSLIGRVAPGGNWAHKLDTIRITNVAPWVRVWRPEFNETTDFEGTWTGELTDDGLRGYLQIRKAQFGKYAADGALSAFRQGATYGIAPDQLQLHTPQAILPDLRLPSGSLSYDGKVIRATRLKLALFGGPAIIEGWYEPAVNQAQLTASWEDLTLPKTAVKQGGVLHIAYTHPPAAQMSVSGKLETRGAAPAGPFEAAVDFGAQGETVQSLTWQFTAPLLAWYRAQPIILNGLDGGGTYVQDSQHRTVRLTRIALPADNRLAGTASYDFLNEHWDANFQGQDWPVRLLPGVRIAFGVSANGFQVASREDPKQMRPYVQLDEFFLRSGPASLSVNGTYDGRLPQPVAANLKFTNYPGPEEQIGQFSVVRGTLLGEANLVGALHDPKVQGGMNIRITGNLQGENATILGHPVGDMKTAVAGSITSDRAVLHADGVPFLGGIWNLGATYLMTPQLHATTCTVAVQNLPLQNVAAFLRMPSLQGALNGQWYFYYPGLAPNPQTLRINGGGEVRDLAASYFLADELHFNTSLQDGSFELNPITLRRGYGQASANVGLHLSQWRQVHATFQLKDWPVVVPAAQLTTVWTGGSDDMQIFLPWAEAEDPAARKLRVNSNINLDSKIAFREQPEGDIQLLAAIEGRIVDLRSLHGELFGGAVRGNGVTNLDDSSHHSTASVRWENLQAGRFVRLYPQLKGLAGTISGEARLAPAAAPRPLEPLTVDLYMRPSKLHWRTVQIGAAQVHAFLGLDRIIAADSPRSTLELAGGRTEVWFTSSRHPTRKMTPTGQEQLAGVTISNQFTFKLDRLSIDQFVQAFDPGHAPGLGYLGGSFFVLGAPEQKTLLAAASVPSTQPAATAPATQAQLVSQPQQTLFERIVRTATLDGNLTLSDSNLAQFGPVSFLFDLMHLGGNVRTATGHGTIELHMEQGRLQVTHLYYFNRGIEARGVATADKVWDVPDNPIQGSVVGTARPLKNVRLPLIKEADAVLNALEGQLTSIEFSGTVKNPTQKVRQLTLKELGSEIRALILGDVQPGGGQ